ncbi:MAG: DUF554 domain-containing protein, partial [Bacteroidota bacterium]|nr:DUF554 domain-containing protein [Bacteroidota bacterium]
VGSIIGLLIHTKLPKKIKSIVFQAIGLFTIFLGIDMALKSDNYLIMIFSLVIGSIIGEVLKLNLLIDKFGDKLKKILKSKNQKFTEGFVTAFLMFCMGSMTILGAFEEGFEGKTDLLFAKSVLDGFSSVILAASLGIGVLLSVVPLILYQGGLTFFAVGLEKYITEPVINQMSAVGGILLIGLGITILEIKNIKVINMIPALLIAVLLAYFFAK